MSCGDWAWLAGVFSGRVRDWSGADGWGWERRVVPWLELVGADEEVDLFKEVEGCEGAAAIDVAAWETEG